MQGELKALREPIKDLASIRGIRQAIKKDEFPISISGVLESEDCHIIDSLSKDYKWRVIIAEDEIKGRAIFNDYKLFDQSVYFYPARDIIFYNANIHGNAISMERLRCIKAILSKEGGTIVTTISAQLELTQSLKRFKENILVIKKDNEYDLKNLIKKLIDMGYERQSQVEVAGEFSVRGEILDVFPPSSDCPFRVDFFDTMIESIRSFDAESQRSIEDAEEIIIFPASEIILTAEEIEAGIERIEKDAKKLKKKFKDEDNIQAHNNLNETVMDLKELLKYSRTKTGLESYLPYFDSDTKTFFDFFDPDETLFFIEEYPHCLEEMNSILDEFNNSMQTRYEHGYILKKQLLILKDVKYIEKELKNFKIVFLNLVDTTLRKFKVLHSENVYATQIPGYSAHYEYLIKDLLKWKKEKYGIVILSSSHHRAKRIANELREQDIKAYYLDSPDEVPKPGTCLVTYGALKKGFLYPEIKFAIVSESDIYGAKITRKKEKRNNAKKNAIQSFHELSVGDFVIHENHGVAVYDGIEKMKVDGIEKDYVKIHFADNGVVYLPVSNLDLLQKYANKDEERKPKLDKLNSVKWDRKKNKVRSSVRNIAKDLIKLYAERHNTRGYQFGPDSVFQQEFEEMFPFQETDDQLAAIDAVKKDMESTRIMDRLICGDVGFGKTEVALRACFKCVDDGKQAAILVPTTILARQHYNTFRDRVGEFPIKIGMVSRLKSAAENKKTLDLLKKGQIDIIIGTHRLLSKDVSFKNLGLLVVDEEQRFGVTHKEKIKQLRKNIDVLTLSATPIPRTLHMSLVGIRDMSVLEEPPVDRMPIQTFVLEKNDETIREAIYREVSRGGQVYYIYNRVEKIEGIKASLSKMLPDVNFAYAHGQMTPSQIEKIMLDFINKKIDVLIATTIIETGIDIPNVNTILIDNADKMGLSQLYQLRGRVGRSNRIAYAFLMYRRDKIISEVASKRLNAIREFSALGSGVRVAMRDLEIRGAGNVLGGEQSGHMGDVGYELYMKMLDHAIRELKLEVNPEDYDIYDFETTIDIKIDAYIPAKYIKSEFIKLDMYKKISMIESEDDYYDIINEMEDRFGKLPEEATNLVRIAYIKNIAHKAFITSIVQNGTEIKLYINNNNKISSQKFAEMLKSYSRKLKFFSGDKPYLLFTPKFKKTEVSKKIFFDFDVLEKLCLAILDTCDK